jgi:hypothetical protein
MRLAVQQPSGMFRRQPGRYVRRVLAETAIALFRDDGEVGRAVLDVSNFGIDEGHAAAGICTNP